MLTTFESADGNTVLAFPRAEYEYESEQGLYVPESVLTGGEYTYDMLGIGLARKQGGQERLRFVVYEDTPSEVDTEIDDILAKLINVGRGKLWTIDSADDLRWAWARPVAMPSLRWAAGDILRKTASLNFRRESDWFGEDIIEVETEIVAANPSPVVVNNPGNARVYNAVITIKGDFAATTIFNLTNAYQLNSTRAGTDPNHWLRYDAGRRRVEFSGNGGSSWAGDYNLFVRTPPLIQLMVLEPGDNEIEHAGIEDGFLTVSFFPAFH